MGNLQWENYLDFEMGFHYQHIHYLYNTLEAYYNFKISSYKLLMRQFEIQKSRL